jgi:hypothetical protein
MCLSLKRDRAKAREQSAADSEALVDARREILDLQTQLADLKDKCRRHGASRAEKGKTLADVYRGGTMKRDHAQSMENAVMLVCGPCALMWTWFQLCGSRVWCICSVIMHIHSTPVIVNGMNLQAQESIEKDAAGVSTRNMQVQDPQQFWT